MQLDAAAIGVIKRTAAFVASNGDHSMEMLAQKQGKLLPFLHPAHPHHGSFRQALDAAKRNPTPDASAA